MIIPNCYTCHKNPGTESVLSSPSEFSDSIFWEPICKECKRKRKVKKLTGESRVDWEIENLL